MSTKWKETVKKLLNKAENPAVTPEERKALISKATELMLKFGIEEAELRDKEKIEESVVFDHIQVSGAWQLKREILVNGIARTFGCFSVNLKNGTYRIFGYKDDIEKVRVLYNSLVVQMFIELSKAEKPDGEHGKAFNNSFMNAYVRVVITRLKEAYRKVVAEGGSGTAVVLYNRDIEVQRFLHQTHPRLVHTSTKSVSNSSAGHSASTSAGHRADIGQSRIGGKRELTR